MRGKEDVDGLVNRGIEDRRDPLRDAPLDVPGG